MEKVISTEVNEQVIIFHDGSRMFVSKNQAEQVQIQKRTSAKDISINGGLYALSSIAKVISLVDYYGQYPDKRPGFVEETKIIEDNRYLGMTLEQIAETSKTRFSGLLFGLKQYIDEQLAKGITPKNAIAIYNEKFDRYKKKFGNELLPEV